jgi:glycogen synthase
MDHSLPGSDGYSIRAKYLLEAQVAAGHVVTVLTSPSQGPDAIDTEIAGVSYRRSQYLRWERAIVDWGGKRLVFGRAIARSLSALLDMGDYDLIHGHTPFTVAGVALREARRRRLPFVYEKRNLWEESAKARGKLSGRWPLFEVARAMDRRVTTRADAVCTITQALRMRTTELGIAAERIFVVGNGVDTTAFVPREADANLRNKCLRGGSFVIGFVGSFFAFEGLPLLVEVFARLRARHPGVRLVLVGDGEDRPKLERLVNELGIGDSVWLVGKVPHASVVDFYAAMDVVVYPRYHSTLTDMISPLKPLEPMAMARCVIGSDVGGIRELVRDGETGLLFSAGSRDALENKLEMLLSKRVSVEVLGECARKYVNKSRQWQHMAHDYDAAYRVACARWPRAPASTCG